MWDFVLDMVARGGISKAISNHYKPLVTIISY